MNPVGMNQMAQLAQAQNMNQAMMQREDTQSNTQQQQHEGIQDVMQALPPEQRVEVADQMSAFNQQQQEGAQEAMLELDLEQMDQQQVATEVDQIMQDMQVPSFTNGLPIYA